MRARVLINVWTSVRASNRGKEATPCTNMSWNWKTSKKMNWNLKSREKRKVSWARRRLYEGEFEGEEFLGTITRSIGGLLGQQEYEGEFEGEEFLGTIARGIGGLLGQGEYEFENEYEGEGEWELEGEWEGEFEGEEFFRRIARGIGRFVQRAAPVLRQVARVAAPIVGTAVGGPVGGMLARGITSQLEGESEFEGEWESEYEEEGEYEYEARVTQPEALAEYMAAAASKGCLAGRGRGNDRRLHDHHRQPRRAAIAAPRSAAPSPRICSPHQCAAQPPRHGPCRACSTDGGAWDRTHPGPTRRCRLPSYTACRCPCNGDPNTPRSWPAARHGPGFAPQRTCCPGCPADRGTPEHYVRHSHIWPPARYTAHPEPSRWQHPHAPHSAYNCRPARSDPTSPPGANVTGTCRLADILTARKHLRAAP